MTKPNQIIRGRLIEFLIVTIFVWTQPALSVEIQRPKEHLPGLTSAQIVLVEVLVSPNQESINRKTVTNIFSRRMEELGFTIITKKTASHDVLVRISCDGPRNSNEEELLFPFESTFHDRNGFQSPPCVFSYFFQGKLIPWQNINRVVYSEGVKIAKNIAIQHPDASSMHIVSLYLEQYEFPLLLATEWGQTKRLIQLFQQPGTNDARKSAVITLLGETHPPTAFPFLVNTLQDPMFAHEVARSLGHFGRQAKPYLVSLLKNARNPDIQAAAANGLGNIGALTGDSSTTPLFLEILTTPGIDLAVQTEIVWALGKAPDFGAYSVLAELENKIWLVRSDDPQLQELRQAVDWSIREVRQGGHTDEY